MGDVRELPDQVTELVELSKAYLRQETLEPAKRLGKVAGMSLLAGVLWAIGAILLAVAGTRTLIRVLPDGDLWSALALVIAALIFVAVAGLIVWRASRG